MKTYFIIFVLILAAVLRLWNLDRLPTSLYWEEMALGYDAYSIAQTGKDFHGNPFPVLAFPSFGDYKPSLYFYAVVPFIKMFGLNAWAVRLPSALAGIATVWLIYVFCTEVDNKRGEQLGLIASLFYAIQPWSLHTSRAGFETNLATMLVVLGIVLVVKGRSNFRYLPFAALTFGLSLYAYHATRVFVPLLGIGLLTMFFRDKKIIRKHIVLFLISAGIVLFSVMPIVLGLRDPALTQRANETSIFADMSAIKLSNRLIQEDGGGLFARLIHHRYVVMSQQVFAQYVRAFNPSFFFINGDENPRHGTGQFGVLYSWELVTVILGIFVLIRRRSVYDYVLIWWIVTAAFPQALTTVSPHTLRFLAAAPAFAIVSAEGALSLFDLMEKKRWKLTVQFAFMGLLFASIVSFWVIYSGSWAVSSAQDWQYGYKELVYKVEQLKPNYSKTYVTREQGRPSIAFLFYGKYNPAQIQSKDAQVRKDQQELLEIENISFIDKIPEIEKDMLYVSSPSMRPMQTKVIDQIILPNGKTVWEIWEAE